MAFSFVLGAHFASSIDVGDKFVGTYLIVGAKQAIIATGLIWNVFL